ncbi:MAG: hypothetical protein A07HR67_02770 [uncultured archaeon A07HR67]|nr:MAG: hypothetical protein A07HR67_02770 [uncultured archaeon A07HR67]
MEQAVRVWIDSSVQPALFRIELNHGLINHNVIRIGTVCRLWISFLNPAMDRSSMAIDTQPLKNQNYIRK